MEELVKAFIDEIKKQFSLSDRAIGYDKKETGYYRIWHTKKEIEKVKENRVFIGNLINSMFYEENLFDVSFVYSYIKEEELKEKELKLKMALELEKRKDLYCETKSVKIINNFDDILIMDEPEVSLHNITKHILKQSLAKKVDIFNFENENQSKLSKYNLEYTEAGNNDYALAA